MRLAAPHPRKSAWDERKGRRRWPPSLRGNESSGECPYVGQKLQKSAGGVRSQIRSRVSAPKRAAAGVNGDLDENPAAVSIRNRAQFSFEETTARRPRTAQTVQDRRRPDGDVRASSSVRFIPRKGGAAVAGPGP